MMNIPTSAHDVALAVQETPRLGLGVHLVLTLGKPILPAEAVPSLVDENGDHFKYAAFIQRASRLDLTEVKAEWRAQIEAFIRAAGRRPDHLDSHHHSAFFTPELLRAMLEVANEYNCPVRNPIAQGNSPTAGQSGEWDSVRAHAPRLMQEFSARSTDTIFVSFYDEGATHEHLLDLVGRLESGTSEIMCHPGYVDETLARESAYSLPRERELNILTDPGMRQAIEARGIDLITFANL
jgi:predicted glycoside hydrolase/deacetylase ChbG (UPF0249 family)